jgi:hypothetical protein
LAARTVRTVVVVVVVDAATGILGRSLEGVGTIVREGVVEAGTIVGEAVVEAGMNMAVGRGLAVTVGETRCRFAAVAGAAAAAAEDSPRG